MMKRKIFFLLTALLCAALLAGCSGSALDIFFPTPSPTATAEPTPSPTAEPTPTPEPTPEPLVPYEGEIRHIFFHSLIVYPEMVFTDRETPMGGYNAGFSEKAELEKILPQLYERGYVLYDLNECYEMADGRMQRKEILLPAGKMPLILSVDDVAYAYGDGYARRLFVDDAGALLYEVPNPSGGVDIIQPDLSHAGGLTEVKKIASMAEAYDVALAPHCPLGPIALASCLNVDATCYNAVIQEQSIGIHYNVGKSVLDYVKNQDDFKFVDGRVQLPVRPGLGVDVNKELVLEENKTPHEWKNPVWRHKDGSVAEW